MSESMSVFQIEKKIQAWEGERLKKEGMERASLNRKELLCAARCFAIGIARKCGSCSIDDVQVELEANGMSSEDLGNAAGSIFTPRREWEFVCWEPSKRASNHSRYIRRWRLR